MKTSLTMIAIAGFLLAALQAEETSHTPVNPALLYWQAAALLPKLSEQQLKEIDEMASGTLPVARAEIDTLGFGPTEQLLRKAAESSAPCEWGLAWEDGGMMPTPHIPKLVELVKIALVQGEASLAQGKTAEGLDWFLKAHRIARHLAAAEFIPAYCAQLEMEKLALKAAGQHCLGWDEATRHGYVEKLKALPPLHRLQDCFHGDLYYTAWLDKVAQLGESMRKEKINEYISYEAASDPEFPEDFRKLLEPETWYKWKATSLVLHDRAEAAFGKVRKEAVPELVAINNEVKRSEFKAMKNSARAYLFLYDNGFVVTTLHTMLEAALDHGSRIDETVAATYHEAFEGQPLRLEKTNAGTLSLVAAGQQARGNYTELKLGQ